MVKANTGQICALRFYYYMFGNSSQMGSINVYTRYADPSIQSTGILLTKSGNLGQQWNRAVIPVNDQRDFQFLIEGQVGKGNQADIAIDDISFSEGCIKSTKIPFTTTNGKLLNTTTGKPLTTTSGISLNTTTGKPLNTTSGKPPVTIIVSEKPVVVTTRSTGINTKPTKSINHIGDSNTKKPGSNSKF